MIIDPLSWVVAGQLVIAVADKFADAECRAELSGVGTGRRSAG